MCFNEFFLCLNPHLGLTCGPITGGWGLILLFEFKIKEGFVIPANVWPGSATVTNWGCCAIICASIYINWQENMCLVFTSYRLGLKTFFEAGVKLWMQRVGVQISWHLWILVFILNRLRSDCFLLCRQKLPNTLLGLHSQTEWWLPHLSLHKPLHSIRRQESETGVHHQTAGEDPW